MARRPTLNDVAAAAGVSVATVNRVVARSGGVRSETAERIARAAAEIGYHGQNLLAKHAARQLSQVRLGFLLHKEKQHFYQAFAAALTAAAAACQTAEVKAEILFSPSQNAADSSALLTALGQRNQAVAATAVNHAIVDRAAQQLHTRAVPLFSLLSDFAQDSRQAYFGLNNIRVGRGVANILNRNAAPPKKFALFVGGNRWQGHELRETGFRSHFREAGGAVTLLDTLINLETRNLTYETTLNLLDRHRDLCGIYVAGGGMEGAIAALKEMRQPGEVSLVVNELTPESTLGLEQGFVTAIVATPLAQLCASLVEEMVSATQGSGFSGQRFFPPTLAFPEF